MSNKRKKRWPRGFCSDGTSCRMKTANGRFRRLGSNEARALRKSHQLRRLENGVDSVGAAASPRMTLRTVAERWLEAQQADGVRDADRDFGRFKNHVDSLIGSKRIGDIEARDLWLMIRELKRQKKANGCPRHADGSIVNILGVCSIHVWSQYDDRPLKTGRASHEKPRFVPVHPVLAKALAEWRLGGFAEVYGRPPSGDDFIVPNPATIGARTQNKAGKDHRADAEVLGIYVPGRLTHGLRRWFISICRNASARRWSS